MASLRLTAPAQVPRRLAASSCCPPPGNSRVNLVSSSSSAFGVYSMSSSLVSHALRVHGRDAVSSHSRRSFSSISCYSPATAIRYRSPLSSSLMRPFALSSSSSSISANTPQLSYSYKMAPPSYNITITRTHATISPREAEKKYAAVVVGAGPAGVTAVGNLLENRVYPILWVDDAFDGGRVSKYYREVPSNTKVKLFIDFAEATAPFRKIVSGVPSRDRWEVPSESDGVGLNAKDDRLQKIRALDQETGCQLGNAADMCNILTAGLRKTPGVDSHQGLVQEAVLDQSTSTWTVRVSGGGSVQSKRIILCTGSTPNDPPLPVEVPGLQHLDLDVTLSPTKLSEMLLPLGPTTVAVVGASHSAVLVLMNLSKIALEQKPDLQIKWFTRHELRYAEYEDGFIARDNTGLKGQAAVWARENLEPNTLPNSPVHKHITKIAYAKGDEPSVYAEHLPGCSYIIQAIGYTRNPLPKLETTTGTTISPVFAHDTGVFYSAEDKSRVPGLYGAGIAFPERVVDRKYGHEEFNVGFFKFMKAVKKWVPEWKS